MVTSIDAVPRAVADSAAHIRIAWLCGTVLLLEGYDIAAVGYAVPLLIEAWRLPPGAFTSALAAGNVGFLLGALIAGMLGDRLGRKPVLIACVIFFGTGSLATALAASPAQLAELRLLTGIGLGGGIPMAIALAADFAPPSAPGRLVLATIAAVPIGFATGGFLTGAVIGSFGWRAIFLIGGAAPLLLSPLLALHLPESPTLPTRALRSSRAALLFQGRWRITTLLLWAINFLSHRGAAPWWARARARIRRQSDIHGGGNVGLRRCDADGHPCVPTPHTRHRCRAQSMNDETHMPPAGGPMSEHLAAPEAITDYLLGNTDEEHERLIRQAARLAPVTEAFFREAGIGAGQRVLDVGSGVGDVAMLLARVVGSSGAVVAVERDAKSVARATARATDASLGNITFVEGDIADCAVNGVFDAVVGRFVLQFLPDPPGALRRLSQSLRRGGIAAFLECSFAPFMALSAHLPLWSTAVRLMYEVGVRHGVRTEMGPELFRTFTEAGLPAPYMRLYMELGHDPSFTRWLVDVLRTIRPHFGRFRISADPLGDLDTLQDRLQAEVASSKTVVPWLSMVGAHAQRTHGT